MTRKIADRDLIPIYDELKGLDHHVADEKRAKCGARRVSRHPVDDPKTDERRTDIARKNLRFAGSREAEVREHRRWEDEEGETEDDRGYAADHESEARTHAGRVLDLPQATTGAERNRFHP